MADEGSLFREEALRHWAQRGGPGDVLRQSRRWADAGFWIVLALFVVGCVTAAIVRVPSYAYGSLATSGADGRIVAHVISRGGARIAIGQDVEVALESGWISGYRVESIARGRTDTGGAIVVDAAWSASGSPPPIASGANLTARVVLASESIAVALVPGMRSLVGRDG